MKKGKYENKAVPARKRASVRSLSLLLALVLLVGGVIGGTIAWLTSTTGEVKNTFSTSDINITLTESDDLNLKMIPGWTITKDPVATVVKDSEDCYLFVKLVKSENFDSYMTYEIADSWTALPGVDGVYYRSVTKNTTEDQPFGILKNNQVQVLGTVTKEMMTEAKTNAPTLTVTAYASQMYESEGKAFEPAKAWENLAP